MLFITIYANCADLVAQVLSQTKDVEMVLADIEGFLETVS